MHEACVYLAQMSGNNYSAFNNNNNLIF